MTGTHASAIDCHPLIAEEGNKTAIPCVCGGISLYTEGNILTSEAKTVTCVDAFVLWRIGPDYTKVGECRNAGVVMEPDYKDIMTINENEALVIYDVELDNAGTYKCQRSNPTTIDYITETVIWGKYTSAFILQQHNTDMIHCSKAIHTLNL